MENYYASGALQPNLWQYKIIIPKEEPKHNCRYSKAMNQSNPRLCVDCGKEEPKQDYSGVHLRHCYQGEYEDGCKYGENDCPAKPVKPKQETIEEVAKRTYQKGLQDDIAFSFYDGVRLGSQWQSERMYSEEDLREAFKQSRTVYNYKGEWQETFSDIMTSSKYETFEEWFEQFKNK
jgi:hypothetical protein